MKYWIIANKIRPKLWKPRNKHDFYDAIYNTKENAESVLSEIDKRYYKAVEVEIQLTEKGE